MRLSSQYISASSVGKQTNKQQQCPPYPPSPLHAHHSHSHLLPPPPTPTLPSKKKERKKKKMSENIAQMISNLLGQGPHHSTPVCAHASTRCQETQDRPGWSIQSHKCSHVYVFSLYLYHLFLSIPRDSLFFSVGKDIRIKIKCTSCHLSHKCRLIH